jgi:hypothetical protein
MERSWSRWAVMALLLAVLGLGGCFGFGSSEVMEEPPPPPPKYMDFKDVRIPDVMNLDREHSFVYETQNIRAGVLSLKGTMELVDVLSFYEANMPRDGWTLLSSFKYNKNILIYTKPEKVCLVVATQPFGEAKSFLELWVSPINPGALSSPGIFSPKPDSAPMPKEEILKEETS